MSGNFSNAAKNTMLNAITVNQLSLHSGDPGPIGTAHELTGGDYLRKACAYNTASGGERALSADVEFDVPALSTVAYVAKWNGVVFMGSDAVTNEVYAGAGRYTVTATGSKLVLSDIV